MGNTKMTDKKKVTTMAVSDYVFGNFGGKVGQMSIPDFRSHLYDDSPDLSALQRKVDANTEKIETVESTANTAKSAAENAQNKLNNYADTFPKNPVASSDSNGLMSVADKMKLDALYIGEGGSTVDNELLTEVLNTAIAAKTTAQEAKDDIAELESDLTVIENAIQDIDGNTLYVTDANGNVVAKINNQGIESVDVTTKDGKKLSEMPNDTLEEFYSDNLYISDANGNIVLHIDGSGHLHYLDDDIFVLNDWKGKVIATYGDSVTAVNNGDFIYPYNFSEDIVKYRWGNRVAKYFRMSNHYGRGIGGTKYMWGGNGGSLCLVEKATGIAKYRYDNYTYDDYLADNTIITIPSGQKAVRGCGCSWLRITSMFPESIKDNVDVVTIMFHNDEADNADASFIEGSAVDLEWSQSEYYTDYGGDYNIETFRGAIASTIMKMQAWMPNAVLVLMSPISGHGTANRFKAYFNILPQVSVGDVYSPDNTTMRMTVTAVTDTENEKSITFATFEYANKLPVSATSLIKKSGASSSASTLNFTSLSDKNLDGTLININTKLPDNDNLYNQINIVDTMSQKLSIPFINIFHNCGINGLNKRLYIADTIHPYSEDGSKMIARAVIGGLKTIIPNF